MKGRLHHLAMGGALTDEVVDVVLLWFREEDGDLIDALVDSITSLADQGVCGY